MGRVLVTMVKRRIRIIIVNLRFTSSTIAIIRLRLAARLGLGLIR